MDKCMIDPSRECLGVEKVRLLEKQLDEYKENARKNHGEMFTRIRAVEIAQAETKTEYGHIMELLGSMKADISSLKEKPAKRWDGLVVGAVLAYAMTGIGLPA